MPNVTEHVPIISTHTAGSDIPAKQYAQRTFTRLANGWLVNAISNSSYGTLFYVSKDYGRTWATLTNYFNETAANISLAASGNILHWVYHYNNETAVWYGNFDVTTATIGNPTTTITKTNIETDSTPSALYNTCICVGTDNSVHVVWSATTSTNSRVNVRYRKSADGGATWSTVEAVTNTTTGLCSYPTMVLQSDNTPIIAYYSNDTISANIAYKNAGTWTQVVAGTSTAISQGVHIAVAPNGRIWLAYSSKNAVSLTYNVRMATATSVAGSWTYYDITTEANNDQTFPVTAVGKDGNAHVIWFGYDASYTASSYYQVRYSKWNGTSWSAPTRLTTNSVSGSYTPFPTVIVDNTIDFTLPLSVFVDPATSAPCFLGAWTESKTPGFVSTYIPSNATMTQPDNQNQGRFIVKLSNGWLIAAFLDNTASGTNTYIIRFYKSTDNGTTWTMICYYDGLTSNWPYTIASNGTMVYLLAVISNASISCYKFDATTVTNTNLSSPGTPETGQSVLSGGGISLAVGSDGTLHAAWSSKNGTYPNSFNIRYSKSTDGGTTWAAVTQVTSTNTVGNDYTHPCIVVKSNNNPAIISQRVVASSNYDIQTVIFNGSSWTQSFPSGSGLGNTQSYPCAVIAPSGRIWVTWQGTDPTDSSDYNIRVSYSDDGGATWSAVTKVTSGNSYNQQFPSITADAKNNVHIVWSGQDGTTLGSRQNVKRVMWDSTSQTWSSVFTLTATPYTAVKYPITLVDTTMAYDEPIMVYHEYSTQMMFRGAWTAGPNLPWVNVGGTETRAKAMKVWTGAAYVDVKAIKVFNGTAYVDSK